MCATSNLVIGVTVFPHKRINKATDHVCIVKKFCQSLQDERVRQGAVVASDHHLLIARVRLKLKKSWTGVSSQCQHYSTIVMKDGENGVTLDNNLKIAVSTVLKVLFIRSPKIEDFNLSFKDYQKIFLQEDSFKKLYAVISKLQQENQNLLEKLNFMNHLEKFEKDNKVLQAMLKHTEVCEQKAPEVPNFQVIKKIELAYSRKMEEFERSIFGKDKK
ncbi:uncharacterized protein LOC129927195 isoform X4 [Biomphalaria glabrata]|uniref:Uncharacterized protein LOC129927195 isoform X4 n=1 Tax=Biomphalaria glabrata TaxID=6526 RepID=A0A9W3ATP1_BIOGL|nr:uncharacterized protein LOC129927195 isoform X4 [Biomphalaria glabrata]